MTAENLPQQHVWPPAPSACAWLGRCEFQQGADTLILVGDLVGKGPHPAQV